MFKSQSLSRRFLGSLLALLLVGFSFLPSSVAADSVTIPGSSNPSEIDTLIQSILEVVEGSAWVVQDYAVYTQAYEDLIYNLRLLVIDLQDYGYTLDSIHSRLLAYIDDNYDTLPSVFTLEGLLGDVEDMQISVDDALGGARYCTNMVETINSEIQEEIIVTSATMSVSPGSVSAGGSCNCPDYTSILTLIKEILVGVRVDMNASLHRIRDAVELGSWGIVNFLYEFDSSLGHEPNNDDEIGLYAGDVVGNLVSNAYDNVYNLNYALRLTSGSFLNSDIVVGSNYPLIMRAFWNDILLPYAEVFNPNIDSPNTDNRMVNAFRDYYINHTNSVTIVSVTNTVDSPVWVSFTNRVQLSTETLLALTNDVHVTVEAFSTNSVSFALDALMERLSNSVLRVFVVTNDINVQVRSEAQVSIDMAEEESGSMEEPEDDDNTLGEIDVSGLATIQTHFRTILNSFSGMFDSFPQDLPPDIVIWNGMDIHAPDFGGGGGGVVEPSPVKGRSRAVVDSGPVILSIPSLHYSPSEDNRFLTCIHDIMGAAWTIGFIFVFLSLAATNLIVASHLIKMLYYTLLGDARGAAKALVGMFRELASLFGGDKKKKRS